MPTGSRTWAGTTLTDRKQTRRAQLIAAGLDLLGNKGVPSVSVRALCRHAKLTERYFYESFADRDELVLAVYQHVGAQAHQALVDAVPDSSQDPAIRAEAAVTAFVELMLDDPRKGRVLLLAPTSDPTLSAHGVALLPSFVSLIREQLPARLSDQEKEMTSIGLVGALTNLFVAYLNGALGVSRDDLIGHCVRLLSKTEARG